MLHADQAATITDLNSKIAARSVSVKEQENRNSVRALIAGASPPERSVLKDLCDRDEISATQMNHLTVDKGALSSSIRKWKPKLIQEGYDRPANENYWSIVPGLKDALIFVLYEDQ